MSNSSTPPPAGDSPRSQNPEDQVDEEIILEIVDEEQRVPPVVRRQPVAASDDEFADLAPRAAIPQKRKGKSKSPGKKRPHASTPSSSVSSKFFYPALAGGMVLLLAMVGGSVWWFRAATPKASTSQSSGLPATPSVAPPNGNRHAVAQTPVDSRPPSNLTPEEFLKTKLEERQTLERERLQRVEVKNEIARQAQEAIEEQQMQARLESIRPKVDATILPEMDRKTVDNAPQSSESARVPVIENDAPDNSNDLAEDLDANPTDLMESDSEPSADGTSLTPEQREILLSDIDRAISMIQQDRIEDLIVEFYPVDLLRAIRKSGGIDKAAAKLRETKRVLQHMQLKLEKSRTGTIHGDDLAVAILPPSDVPEPSAIESKPVEAGAPKIIGYGSDFNAAISQALLDLKEQKYETFLEKMLPIPEVIRLKNADELSLRSQQFVDYPELLQAMTIDLEAIQALNTQTQGNVVRVALNSQIPGELPREIRFQSVSGSWRFFDQTTEALTLSQAGPSNKSTSTSKNEKPLLRLERVGDHWRLVSLP